MNNLFTALQLINTFIFVAISGIHFYWAFGGKLGVNAVIPEILGKSAFKPSFLATIIMAFAMVVAAWLSWRPTIGNSDSILIYGNLAVAIIFLIRAIGDFKYVGFTKKIKDSIFAKNDTNYYSPLCLIISAIAIFIYWQTR